MNLGRAIARGIVGEIEKESRRRETYTRLQSEAASRPGSTHVQTPWGPVWMSPIEHRLYEAMRKDGLDPVPQFRIEGYYADFAFPDVRLAVEADGAAYHGEDRRQRDRRRDWILRRAGWTVQRFHGTTIHRKAENCSYVVKREVDGRRAMNARLAWEAEVHRQERREALLRPFRSLLRFLRRR